MQTEHVRRLISDLRATDPTRFSIKSWYKCAFGVMMQDSYFLERGIHNGTDLTVRGPHYQGLYGFAALALFFGVTRKQAIKVFESSAYGPRPYPVRPLDVIAQIHKYWGEPE